MNQTVPVKMGHIRLAGCNFWVEVRDSELVTVGLDQIVGALAELRLSPRAARLVSHTAGPGWVRYRATGGVVGLVELRAQAQVLLEHQGRRGVGPWATYMCKSASV